MKRSTVAGGASKKSSARRKPRELRRGVYVRTYRDSVARSKTKIGKGQLLLAVEDVIGEWLPVLFRGRVELVPSADVKVAPPAK